MREGGTEPAFSGKYYKSKDDGIYRCAACGNELFSSDAKFDSGTGWPSFTAPFSSDSVKYREDNSLGMKRTEVLCGKCGSHLGHIFSDGPKAMPDGKPTTGKRFCMNSVCLELESKK